MKKKNYSTLLAFCLCLLMALSLVGCGEKDEEDLPQDSGQAAPAPEEQVPPADLGATTPDVPGFGLEGTMGGDGIDFQLQSSGNPDFNDVPVGSFDTGLYTVEDGFTYALDPATLEKVGPPLDPVTHEPLEEQPTETPLEPEQTPTEAPQEETTPPPAEVKLPNTGMFLEDD